METRTLRGGWWTVAVLWVLAVPALLGLFVWVPWNAPYYGLFDNGIDLEVYRAGGRMVRWGLPVYGDPVCMHGGTQCGDLAFTYPPFSALLFTIVSFAGKTAMFGMWTVATLACVYWVILRTFRSLGTAVDLRLHAATAALVVLSLFLEPVRNTVWFGQINVFLMALVVWDLTRGPGSRLRGVGIGIAAGIKLVPAFFWAFLVVTRRWRALVVSMVTFAVTVVLGFVMVLDAHKFWLEAMFKSERVGAVSSPSNQAVSGYIVQFHAFVTRTNVLEAPKWQWLIGAVIVALIGLTAAWAAHTRGQVMLAVVLVGMTASLASPMSWAHHWVWFVPLMVIMVHHFLEFVARRAVPAILALGAGIVAFYLLAMAWVSVFPPSPWGPVWEGKYIAVGLVIARRPNDFLYFLIGYAYLWIFLGAALTALAVYLRPALADFREERRVRGTLRALLGVDSDRMTADR